MLFVGLTLSLDFDDTYTRDPAFWDSFIELAKKKGHRVYCVTLRHPQESADVMNALQNKVEKIFCTGRKSKRAFTRELGIHIDIWIDDMPFFIDHDVT